MTNQDKIYQWIAARMPKRLIYMATIRAFDLNYRDHHSRQREKDDPKYRAVVSFLHDIARNTE